MIEVIRSKTTKYRKNTVSVAEIAKERRLVSYYFVVFISFLFKVKQKDLQTTTCDRVEKNIIYLE